MNFKLLIEAITVVKDTYNAFTVEDKDITYQKNYHRMALSRFQLGYMYHKHADKLGSTDIQSQLNTDEYDEHLTGSIEQSHARACGYFDEAFEFFQQIHHIKGMAVCKKLAAEVMPKYSEQAL